MLCVCVGGGWGLHELTLRCLLGLPILTASRGESAGNSWGPPCLPCGLGSGQGSQALQPSRAWPSARLWAVDMYPGWGWGGWGLLNCSPRKCPGLPRTFIQDRWLAGLQPGASLGICVPSYCPHWCLADLPVRSWCRGLSDAPLPLSPRMGEFSEKATCGTVCLKYLLFTFNCCFWVRSPPPPSTHSPLLPPIPGPGKSLGLGAQRHLSDLGPRW